MHFRLIALCLLSCFAVTAEDEYLHGLYDRLHDSPMQAKFRRLAPMPFGVVFLPWAGATEQDVRRHFRLMKQLGFHNLKQVQASPEWTAERLMEIALEEDVIPFWYGEGGWEDITPALLTKLGIPLNTPIPDARRDPRMRTYQKQVIARGISKAAGTAIGEGMTRPPGAFRHTPDPYLQDFDTTFFKTWLRDNYRTPRDVATAWNQYEVGIDTKPFVTWIDVDKGVDQMAQQERGLRGYGGEYGRVRDVLRYKADYHTREIQERATAQHAQVPEAPTRTGGEMGLFLPFAWRATKMEDLAQTQTDTGSFYPSIHFAWHFGEVGYEVARPIYMQASFARDLFKGGWAATWESTGGPQQLTGGKGWDKEEGSTTPGFTVNAGTMTQLLLSYLAAGFRGAGIWAWNYRAAGWEGGEYGLLNRQLQPSPRAVRAGKIAQAAERYRDELWQAHKEPAVGVLLNWDSDAIWAAISIKGRDHFRHYPMQARVGVSRALIDGNVPFEYVTVRDLQAGLAPRYKVIFLPAQLAISDDLLKLLTQYVSGGGRVVLDSPGAMYDEHGKVLNTARGSAFEKLFGAEVNDFQYSNNVPRTLQGRHLTGFISELTRTSATTKASFQTGEAAVTENRVGKGTAVILAWDSSFSLFKPGNTTMEAQLRSYALGSWQPEYICKDAIVYRLAGKDADHYFFINDDEAKQVQFKPVRYTYRAAVDPVSNTKVALNAPIALEAHSGRWIRFEK